MYFSEQDPISGDAVGMLSTSPSFNVNTDHERVVELALLQQANAKQLDTCGVLVLIIDTKYPPPNPTWRKRHAELRNEIRYREFRFAIVTPLTIMRGALRAMNWMQSPSSRFQTNAFATFDEAALWAAGQAKVPLLRRLEAAVLKQQAEAIARADRG